jgi:hypothetical protein
LPADPDIRGPPDDQVLVRFTLMMLLFRYHWEKTRRHQSAPRTQDPHDGDGGGDDDDHDDARAIAMADDLEQALTTSAHQDQQYTYRPARVVAPTSKRTQGTNARVATPTPSASRARQPLTGGSYAGSSISSSQGSSSHAGSGAFMEADEDEQHDFGGDDLIIYQSSGRQRAHRSAAASALDDDDEFNRGMSNAAKRRFGTYDIFHICLCRYT